jgi:hypothetical protein
MQDDLWLTQFEAELAQAEAARRIGNEGMARVCARRAVGWMLGEYFLQQGILFSSPSAYERIKFFLGLSGISGQAQEVAEHFTLRLTPDHELPVQADLIAEARWLKRFLLED